MTIPENIIKITDTLWEIPTCCREDMGVPARIYPTGKLLSEMDPGVIQCGFF